MERTTTETALEQTLPRLDFEVAVSNWARSRHLFIEGAAIYLEIYRAACSHCPTCTRRMKTVTANLADATDTWEFIDLNGGTYLKVTPSEWPESLTGYLSDLLRLQIGIY